MAYIQLNNFWFLFSSTLAFGYMFLSWCFIVYDFHACAACVVAAPETKGLKKLHVHFSNFSPRNLSSFLKNIPTTEF